MMNEFEVFLTWRNESVVCRTVRDDGRATEFRLYSPDMRTSQREVSRWMRVRGCVPLGGWARDGVGQVRRRFVGEPFSEVGPPK